MKEKNEATSKPTFKGIDSKVLLNVHTIAFVGCLIPKNPFSTNLPLTLAIYSFVIIAMLNHSMPKRLNFLTHVVKALYTWLLFISIKSPYYIPIIISVIDLFPLAISRINIKKIFETTGAAARIIAITIGFYLIHFNPLVLIFYLICNAVYFIERKHRIINNRRHSYGWAHSFEHLSIFVYLFAVNYDSINHLDTYACIFIMLTMVASLFCIIGISINKSLYKKNINTFPQWFDKKLEPSFVEKLSGNNSSKKFYNYMYKPFSPYIFNTSVGWSDIELIVNEIVIKQPIDVIVGILSGGAFISNKIALNHDIKDVVYIKSRYWSNISLLETIKKVFGCHPKLSDNFKPEISIMDAEFSFANKTILVVDDSICTGKTMTNIVNLLNSMGAKKVITYALFCHSDYQTDYYYKTLNTPLVWPWGWEAD